MKKQGAILRAVIMALGIFYFQDRKKIMTSPLHFKRLCVVSFLIFSITLYFSDCIYAKPFTDDIGRNIEITKKPERIISLAPNITEILFFLQLGDKIAGVTDFCDYPEEAKLKPKVGWLISPSIEKIISLRPDIVFATAEGNRPDIVEELERMKINVYVMNPHSISDVLREIKVIGNITGQVDIALTGVNALTRRIDNIKKKIVAGSQKRVMYLVSIDPVISIGPGSFIHDMLTTAGGINVLSDSPIRYPRIDMEEIILKDPEVIIAPTDLIDSINVWKKRWGGISAITHGNVYPINPDIISRPGPRIVDGLEQIYEYIHGTAKFKNQISK